MKQKWISLFFALTLLVGFVPIFANAATTPNLIISEIAWAGSSTSNADEWVELTNVSDYDINVTGWTLTGASSAPIIFPTDSLITSHSTFLIANYANTNTSSTLNAHAQIITTLVSIPNDKLTIILTSQDGSVVDSAGNGGTLFAGKSGGTGSTTDGRFRSMERRDFLIDGTIKEAWTDADTFTGFKDGTSDYGTPGVLNAYLQMQIMNLSAQSLGVPIEDTEIPALLEQVSVQESIVETTPTAISHVTEPVVDPAVVTDSTTTEPEQICEDVTVDTDTISTTNSTQTPIEPLPVVTESTNTISNPIVTIVDTTPTLQTVSTSATPSVQEQAQATSLASDTWQVQSLQIPQGTLRVSEVFPHPGIGESEWVELENTSIYPVTTNGWNILDASGAVTILPDSIVNPGSFLVIENPKGKLNNDGDSVIVKDANGSVVDSVLYNADLGSVPSIDESLIRENTNTFVITTTPTKNTSNILTPRSTATSTNSTSNANSTSNTTTIEPVATNVETIIPTNPVAPALQGQVQDQPLQIQTTAVIKTLRLSELYPNTNGNDLTDEFIEIENTGDQTVSLDGWSVTDAGGTKFSFAKDTLIAPHAFKAFLHPETKISLNNSGDTITLTAPDGSIVESQTYDQAKTSLTYARTGDVWNWTTTRTPNESNVVSGNSDPISTAAPIATTATSSAPASTQPIGTIASPLLTIDDVKQLSDGVRVKIHGVVTVLPNTFNSQTMYIQDATGGIQIFKSDCRFPTLVEGQSITVSGVLSHINGEARIKVTNQKSLIVSSAIESVTPSLDTTSVGSLITIAGMVMSRSGNRLALNVNGETMSVDLPKITTAVYKTGSNIQVSGILAKSKSGNILKTRSEKDVTTIPQNNIEEKAPNITDIGSAEPKQTFAIILILLASLAFLGFKFKPRLYALMHSYGKKQSFTPRS